MIAIDGARNLAAISLFNIICLAFLALLVSPAKTADITKPPLENDLSLAISYMQGRFDNYEQVYWERALNTPKHLQHRQISSVYIKVDLPDFGDNVIYADKYWDGDPSRTAYRNLYVLKPDANLDAVRLRLLTIPNPERLDGALENLSLLKQLTPEEMIEMDLDCDTVFRRWGDDFRINMIGECWLNTVHPSNKPVSIIVETILDADDFWVLSYGYGVDGSQMYGPLDLIPSKEVKARSFTCAINIASNGKLESYIDLSLHDQGGIAQINSESEGVISIRLRQLVWPIINQTPALALFILRQGQEEILINRGTLESAPYATAPRDATRIELSIPGIRASCAMN
ncbi:MAG: CpcT/CpeT family chromophore lyase [Rhodospirillaceae bacterium]